MAVLRIPADDLCEGDIIIGADGHEITVETLHRDDVLITTNRGTATELNGYVWQHVEVRRTN
jgi:hypothetical protein